jgi:DNA-binding transcriptional ArsR family regulator
MPETKNNEHLHEALERIFHEPGRLAIMSAVCAADKGLSFTELKESCNLTDGNLNRHLKVLEDAGAVRIEKAFVQSKPRTTVRISRKGLEQFSDYLAALAGVLDKARKAIPAEKRRPVLLPGRVVPVRT